MKTFKKMILTALCACCAWIAGVATLGINKEVKTASAAVATDYTVVDTSVLAKLEDVYVANGNFRIYMTFPQMDTDVKNGDVAFTGVDLATVFDGFGFFDNVMIGEKTLRELGCTSFYQNTIGFGVSEPQNIVLVYCHADPEIWSAAVAKGEVAFGNNQTPVTFKKGTMVPGYTYLNGDENAVVYRTNMDYVTERVTDLTYSYFSAGQTKIDSLRYVQGHDGTCGYLGVSFEGDDYAIESDEHKVFIADYKHAFMKDYLLPNSFLQQILVNGEANKIDAHALLNLGEAGKGHFSFVIYVPENDVKTITIPKGTYFPAYVMESLMQKNGHFVYIGYATTEDVTFYKTANNEFVLFNAYVEDKGAELNAYRATKVNDEYFASDVVAMDEAVSVALQAINNATTIEEIETAFNVAIAVIDGAQTKEVVIADAWSILSAYKINDFRPAEEAERSAMAEAGYAAMFDADSKEAVDSVLEATKAQIDTLKTAAQYADEELAADKAAARAEITGYLADVAYLAEQVAERDAAVEAGLAAVTAAKSVEEIAQAVVDVKTAVDALTTKATIVDAAKADLDVYKADVVYRAAEKEARAAAIATAKTALDNAESQADVDNAVTTAKMAIDALKSDIELTEEEKAAADAMFGEQKASALAEINELKASLIYEQYSEKDQAKLNALYYGAKLAVANALTEEEIAAVVANFQADVAAVEKLEINDSSDDESSVNDGGEEDSSIVDSDSTSSAPQQSVDMMAMLMSGCQASASLAGIVTMVTLCGALMMRKRKED